MKRICWLSTIVILIALLASSCGAKTAPTAGPVGPGPQDIQPADNNPGGPGPGNPGPVGPGPENPGPGGLGPGNPGPGNPGPGNPGPGNPGPGGPTSGGPEPGAPTPGGGGGPVSTPTVKSGGGGSGPTKTPTVAQGYVDIGITTMLWLPQTGGTNPGNNVELMVIFENLGTKKWSKSEDPSSSGDLEIACSRNWTVGGKISTSSYSGSVPREQIDDPGESSAITPWWIDPTGVTAITVSCHITKGSTYDSDSSNNQEQGQWDLTGI
jgi:hypothetical protein